MSQSTVDHSTYMIQSTVNQTYMIQSMCAALRNLNYVQASDQTPEYKDICAKITQFIECNCVHKIVFDSIDISPDNSKTIKYCLHCEKSFD